MASNNIEMSIIPSGLVYPPRAHHTISSETARPTPTSLVPQNPSASKDHDKSGQKPASKAPGIKAAGLSGDCSALRPCLPSVYDHLIALNPLALLTVSKESFVIVTRQLYRELQSGPHLLQGLELTPGRFQERWLRYRGRDSALDRRLRYLSLVHTLEVVDLKSMFTIAHLDDSELTPFPRTYSLLFPNLKTLIISPAVYHGRYLVFRTECQDEPDLLEIDDLLPGVKRQIAPECEVVIVPPRDEDMQRVDGEMIVVRVDMDFHIYERDLNPERSARLGRAKNKFLRYCTMVLGIIITAVVIGGSSVTYIVLNNRKSAKNGQ